MPPDEVTRRSRAIGLFSLQEPVERFLDRIASAEPAPASGSVAAVAVAMAAGLVAMAARLAGPACRHELTEARKERAFPGVWTAFTPL